MAVKNQQSSSDELQNSGPFRITKTIHPGVEQYEVNGEWTQQENEKYATFIKKNLKLIEGKELRRIWPIFKKMAEFIKSRNFTQCKSHHQRLYNQFQTIPEILEHLASNSYRVKPKKTHFQIVQSPPITLEIKQNKTVLEKVQEFNQPIFKAFIMSPVVPSPIFSKAQPGTGAEYPEAENNWYAQQGGEGTAIAIMSQGIQGMRGARGMQAMSYTMQSETSIGGSISEDRRAEWMECYKIFMLWATKLKRLTENERN